MKKWIGIICLFVVLVVGGLMLPTEKENVEYDYLRIHIRANSNQQVDQNIKYKIKDKMVSFLTPHLCQVKSKAEAIEVVEKYSNIIESECESILRGNGFKYSVNVKIANEYFPTRTYSNTTLESGYYDTVIVELGEAKGDNWWCVMYPPLCFVNKNNNNKQIKYKSIIAEWWNKIF